MNFNHKAAKNPPFTEQCYKVTYGVNNLYGFLNGDTFYVLKHIAKGRNLDLDAAYKDFIKNSNLMLVIRLVR